MLLKKASSLRRSFFHFQVFCMIALDAPDFLPQEIVNLGPTLLYNLLFLIHL